MLCGWERILSLLAHALQGAPPLAWQPNAAQQRFLRFHTRLVEKWRWHFVETQLRAYTEHGQTATIWKDDLAELLHRGLMFKGMGAADVHLTEQGRVFAHE
jgi:hypothetical protein